MGLARGRTAARPRSARSAVLTLVSAAACSAACPLTAETQIVYSRATGVGGASNIWVHDLLWWLCEGGKTCSYLGLNETEIQSCEFASYTNLRLYINPGGDAYNQLSAIKANGSRNIINFVRRNQTEAPSAYAGFCAGGYLASYAYVWETMFEGPGYFNFKEDPPLNLFPHMVEGSLVDIGARA